MSLEFYSAGELSNILCKSIPEFKVLLKKDETIGGDMKSFLPSPENFRYLHEFKEYEYRKKGILVVGLNPHLGKEKRKLSHYPTTMHQKMGSMKSGKRNTR